MKNVGTVIVGERDILHAGFIGTLRASRFKITREVVDFHELERTTAVLKSAALFVVIEPVRGREETQRVIRLIRAANARTCIAVVSQDKEDVAWAFICGADGCLPRTISPSALLMALDLLVCGEVRVGTVLFPAAPSPTILMEATYTAPARQATGGVTCEHLSQREREVLDCVARGDSNKRIARHLAIGEATVKGHVRTVLRKIGATNRTQAAVWAHALPPFSSQRLSGATAPSAEALPH